MSFKDRVVSAFEDDASPIAQQAGVQPLRRFESSEFAADPRLGALAISLAVSARTWLNAVFNAEAGFYPGVQPSDVICADLAAFVARRLSTLAHELDDEQFIENIGAICDVMYPASVRSNEAVALLSEFESAQHDPDDEELGLKWSRVVRAGVDSLIVGETDKNVDAQNADAVMKRIVVLPTTLPFPGAFGDTVADVLSEIEADALGGPGIWSAPLTGQQIQHAIRYGLRQYGTTESMEQPDPYDAYVGEAQVLVTVATVYGRIAAYAGQVSRVGGQIDQTALEQINLNEALQGNFGVRAISRHKNLDVVAIAENGTPQTMIGMDRSVGRGQHSVSGFFSLPAERTASHRFLILIPQLFARPKEFKFTFDFGLVH